MSQAMADASVTIREAIEAPAVAKEGPILDPTQGVSDAGSPAYPVHLTVGKKLC
jgi:hypothetical protein